MSKRIGVYAGSFDPITRGHEWVISEAARLFDEVVVVVADNAAKRCMFSCDERVEMVRASVVDLPHVRVCVVRDQFVVQWAHDIGARWLIRGMRNVVDFEYEMQVLDINRRMQAHVSTVYLPASPLGVAVSSSTVKGLVGISGWREQAGAYVSPHVLHALHRTHARAVLRDRFVRLWHRFDADSDADALFDYIFAQYSEPHRRYHTWQHLFEVLHHFDAVRDYCNSPGLTEFALWVHGLFYDIGAKDNEARSAEEGRRLIVEAGLCGESAAFVYAVVDALAHVRDPGNEDEACAMDCDLAILGAPRERYREYAAQIRAEYADVAPEDYCAHRARFMRVMLERPVLFRTEVFRDRYEARARENLAREIAMLERGEIPSL